MEEMLISVLIIAVGFQMLFALDVAVGDIRAWLRRRWRRRHRRQRARGPIDRRAYPLHPLPPQITDDTSRPPGRA